MKPPKVTTIEKLWAKIVTNGVYNYSPKEWRSQAGIPSKIYEEARRKRKQDDLAAIEQLLIDARVDELKKAAPHFTDKPTNFVYYNARIKDLNNKAKGK